MKIWLRPALLETPVALAIPRDCPVEAVRIFFHHLLADSAPVPESPLAIPRSSPAFDPFLRMVDEATQAILRGALPRMEILRGGAVVSPDGRLRLIAGRSLSGKTSRIAALVAAGWSYVGDDFLFFDPSFGRVHFLPICLLHRHETSISLHLVPCLHPHAELGRAEPVEVLEPRGGTGPRSAALEMFSLFLRKSGRPFPFRSCCERLAPAWAKELSGRMGQAREPGFSPAPVELDRSMERKHHGSPQPSAAQHGSSGIPAGGGHPHQGAQRPDPAQVPV